MSSVRPILNSNKRGQIFDIFRFYCGNMFWKFFLGVQFWIVNFVPLCIFVLVENGPEKCNFDSFNMQSTFDISNCSVDWHSLILGNLTIARCIIIHVCLFFFKHHIYLYIKLSEQCSIEPLGRTNKQFVDETLEQRQHMLDLGPISWLSRRSATYTRRSGVAVRKSSKNLK